MLQAIPLTFLLLLPKISDIMDSGINGFEVRKESETYGT